MQKSIDIPAVHDKDLKRILEILGLYEEFEKGNLACANCGKKIVWDNLFALKVEEQSVLLFCDEPDCIENSND